MKFGLISLAADNVLDKPYRVHGSGLDGTRSKLIDHDAESLVKARPP